MMQASTKAMAMRVLRRLRAKGFEALFAGGCVRDMLLGLSCADYDVATNATPQDVRRLFSHVLLVGAKFGVAMVIHRRRKVEVTTFRSDLPYHDGRRPEGVVFTSAEEDAKRRDFTINGMFYDPIAKRVIDYVGGRDDLHRRVVRTIGEPRKRFAEDYLRMIRAVRFAIRLGFSIDPPTAESIQAYAPHITSISGERIFDELSKMLRLGSAAEALGMLADLGLAKHILPELFSPPALWPQGLDRVSCVARRCDLALSLSALLAGLAAGQIGGIVRRWGASNELKESLTWISKHLDDWRHAERMSLADFKRLLARDEYSMLERLWAYEERKATGHAVSVRRVARRRRAIDPRQIAPPPMVTGDDLKKLGLCEGRLLGRILRELYDAQLNEQLSSRDEAMNLARQMARRDDPAER